MNKKCNTMNSYLVLGVCPIRVWAGDPWGPLGVVPLLVVVDLSSSEIIENECHCTENCSKNQQVHSMGTWSLDTSLPPPPLFFWISLVGIFSSKCMNISIKYKWIKIKFTHFREIIITITTNQKKGQVRGMIVVSKLKVLSHTPVLDFNTYNSWRRAQSSWGKSWWELHLWGRTRHWWHTCTMKKRVEFPLVFFTF